jgi:hypothetical protein
MGNIPDYLQPQGDASRRAALTAAAQAKSKDGNKRRRGGVHSGGDGAARTDNDPLRTFVYNPYGGKSADLDRPASGQYELTTGVQQKRVKCYTGENSAARFADGFRAGAANSAGRNKWKMEHNKGRYKKGFMDKQAKKKQNIHLM